MMGPLFFVANAMEFDSVASASSWEPFHQGISALALAYFFQKDLVENHRSLLDLAAWDDEPGDGIVFIPGTACSKYNQGIINADGIEESSPYNIFVDNNLMADIRHSVPMPLVAAAENISTIMGQLMLYL